MYYSVQFEEFRRSEVRSKCTDRGSLGDRQAKVAVLFTAKMLCRTPKLPFRLRSEASGFYSIGLFLRLAELFVVFFFEPLRRSSRSEYFDYSIGEVLFDRIASYYSIEYLFFGIVSHVQSLRSLPALRRLAENQLSDSPSAYRKPLGFLLQKAKAS